MDVVVGQYPFSVKSFPNPEVIFRGVIREYLVLYVIGVRHASRQESGSCRSATSRRNTDVRGAEPLIDNARTQKPI